MFRASLCPSSGEQEFAVPHMVFCTGCDGCGCVELGRKACVPAQHNHSHHNQCKTPYAAVHTLVVWSWDGRLASQLNTTTVITTSAKRHMRQCTLLFCGAGTEGLRPSSTQPQPSQTVQNTICGSAHYCSPDDGHNDARNMLR